MSSTTTIETDLTNAETLALRHDDQPNYKNVPGGFEVEAKGSKWFTSSVPNTDYIPPKEFKFPGNTSIVAINPTGPTEIPQKLLADYTKVCSYLSGVFSHLNNMKVPVHALSSVRYPHPGTCIGRI